MVKAIRFHPAWTPGLVLGLFIQPSWSRASIEIENPSVISMQIASPDSTEEIERQIDALDREIGSLRKEVSKKSKMFFQLKNGASQPLFIWETESKIVNDRKKLIPLFRFEIRSLLARISNIEMRREELGYELEFLKMKTQNSLEIDLASRRKLKSTKEFKCENFPVQPLGENLEVSQDFGPQKDLETGLKWTSSGWWISKSQGVVRSCAAGVLVYQGIVSGRGRVVLIDHGDSMMTLYANMGEISDLTMQSNPFADVVSDFVKKVRGTLIPSGSILGFAKEKFYFEIRKSGSPVNPRLALSSEQQTKLQF